MIALSDLQPVGQFTHSQQKSFLYMNNLYDFRFIHSCLYFYFFFAVPFQTHLSCILLYCTSINFSLSLSLCMSSIVVIRRQTSVHKQNTNSFPPSLSLTNRIRAIQLEQSKTRKVSTRPEAQTT